MLRVNIYFFNGQVYWTVTLASWLRQTKEIFIITIGLKQNDLNGPINNNTASVQIMACRLFGDKPLSEPMMRWFTDAYMRHPASMS